MLDRTQLGAVLVDPYDDAPRLILADWLEERGFRERAEFIRVQCELASQPKTGWSFLRDGTSDDAAHHAERYDTNPRIEALQRRSTQLVNLHANDWFKFGSFNPTALAWGRGFVSYVRCTLADWYGGKCQRCSGMGGMRGGPEWWACDFCSGIGRIVGRGVEIVKHHPVTRVEISDRFPHDPLAACGAPSTPGATRSWFNESRPRPDPDTPTTSNLPSPIFVALTGFKPRLSSPARWKGFESAQAAIDALSLALVNWAREEAGLPNLKELKSGCAIS